MSFDKDAWEVGGRGKGMSVSAARMADIAVLAALMENESARPNLMANYSGAELSIAAGFANGSIKGKQPCWTSREDEVLRRNLHLMPMEELSKTLGRTKTAISLRRRKLGIPSISAKSGLPAHTAGMMLGFDSGKEISRLVREGILPGRRTPLGNNRFAIDYQDLLRWAIRPGSWIYFEPAKVAEPKIRRLAMLSKKRWGDEWWTTQQVGDLYGISQSEVARHCREGKIPSVRPVGGLRGYRIQKSIAEGLTFWERGGFSYWSEETEEFSILATAIGYPYRQVDRMANWPLRRTSHRMQHLIGTGQLSGIIERLGLPVQIREDNVFWADWRNYRNRFIGIGDYAERLQQGRRLKQEQRYILLSVMASWLEWFSDPDDEEAQRSVRRLRYAVAAKMETLEMWVRKLDSLGIHPFEKE